MKTKVTPQTCYLKTGQVFLVLVLCTYINTWILQNYVMTREVYYNLLAERLEVYRIDKYFEFVQKISFLTYIFIPFALWIKIAFTTLLIQFPLVFKFIDIPFKKMFRIVTLAQVSFLVMEVVKIIRLLRLPVSQITKTTLAVVPFSLTDFLNPAFYPESALKTLNHFNIFEIAWCVIIAFGLVSTGKLKKTDSFILMGAVWTLLVLFQWVLMMYLEKVNT